MYKYSYSSNRIPLYASNVEMKNRAVSCLHADRLTQMGKAGSIPDPDRRSSIQMIHELPSSRPKFNKWTKLHNYTEIRIDRTHA